MASNVTTMSTTNTTETSVRPFLEEYRLELIIISLSFLVAVIVLVMIACLCTRRRRMRSIQPGKTVRTAESARPRAQQNQYVVQHSATQQRPPRKTSTTPSTTPSTTMQTRPHRTHRQQSETSVDRITDHVGKDLVKSSMIDSRRLTLKEVIGCGTFGDVYKGILLDQDMKNPQKVAVKTLNEETRDDEKKKEAFVKEALLMKGFKHKNVLCMLAITFKNDSPRVILPFMENGDLKTFLGKENRTFTVKDLVEFGIQVAEGMACLAENNYVHRDLAARNCLVDAKLVVKIADFGLVRDLHSDDYYLLQDLSTPLPIKWMALESVTQKKFSLRTDVWSYGIVLWEILTRGQKPYPGLDNAQVIKFIKKGKRMAAPPKCPPIVYNIMVRCWSAESSKRPSFKQIIQELKDILVKGTSKREASRIVEEYYTEPIPHDD